MKKFSKVLITLSLSVTFFSANETDVYIKIEHMKKGIDGYVVGKTISKEQKKILQKNALSTSNKAIIKFLGGKNLIIAINAKNNKVLAINKRFPKVKQDAVKGIIGNMIHDYDEPTAMAHNRMVYWVFNEQGNKLSEDDLKNYKDAIKGKAHSSMPLAFAVNIQKKDVNFNPYVSIKLSSDQPMIGGDKQKKVTREQKLSNVYLMISSEKLIRLTTEP